MISRTGLIVAIGALAYVALGIFALTLRRTTERSAGSDNSAKVDRYLRRTDLLDQGKPPENIFEWIIVFSQLPKAQIGAIFIAAIITVTAALAGYPNVAGVAAYFTVVALLMLILFYGWDKLEACLGHEPPASNEDVRRIEFESLPEDVKVRMSRLESAQTTDGQPPRRAIGVTDLFMTVILVIIMLLIMGIALLVFETLL